MKTGLILVIIGAIFFISGMVIALNSVSGDYTIEKVDCYDEKMHKINDLTCDKKVYGEDNLYYLGLGIEFIGGFLLVIGSLSLLSRSRLV